jgi:hypothetical protein
VTVALGHAEGAPKLIADAYYLDEDIVDDTDFTRKYNEAFDIGYDLTNMSNMMITPMSSVLLSSPF